MRCTELQLQPVSVECMVAAELLPHGHLGDSVRVCVENLQPDMVLVSHSLKRIGLLDLCRPFDSILSSLLQLSGANSAPTDLCWRRCGHMWQTGGR